jgi:SAM-dependent methyltransferase
LKGNPGFILPPAYLAFDAYSAPAWKFYKYSGEDTAIFIRKVAEEYLEKGAAISSVYEWGCGPGRVIRHLPGVFDTSVKVYGSDYNKETIDWCKQNLPGIRFFVNDLTPPLDFPGNQFDLIYCISVFTHLSENNGLQWAEELFRILKPGGILIITNVGENSYNTELLPEEKRKYNKEGIVVRGQYKEGKKMFLTMHNPLYIRQTLLKKFEILQHLPTGFPHISQECWIARKGLYPSQDLNIGLL